MIRRRVLLMILDGWGIADDKTASAINRAHTPFIDSLYTRYPHSRLAASGAAVGLPDGQMGNSEVGHITLGAGRVVYQDLVRISQSIASGELACNETLVSAFAYAEAHGKKVHLMGLVSDGGVHSHIDHLKGLLALARQRAAPRVFVHAFTDGRDTDPHSGARFLAELEPHLEGAGQLATVMGRYFAMDRDHRWERIKKAYDALTHGVGRRVSDLHRAVAQAYAEGLSDEFLPPMALVDKCGEPVAPIVEGDVVICFNFRTDRSRQITEALTQRAFLDQAMQPLALRYITLTRYDEAFQNVEVVFEKRNLTHTLGEVVAQAGLRQLRIAETEKYPHVTFFFSGGREEPFVEERRILCPSPKVATYDLKPEMSAPDVRQHVVEEIGRRWADFICLNFANPDMVGHTGVFDAAVKACETVDRCAKETIAAALNYGYTTLLVADHGNAEKMINPDGSSHTAHTTNPAPCILIDELYRGVLRNGALADIAPTILTMMGLPIPPEMTGLPLVDWPATTGQACQGRL